MAKIILSGMISDITGSIGGTTYSRCRSGNIAKSKPNQRKASSRWQHGFLSVSSQVAGAWQQLTTIQLAQWSNFATYRNHTKHKSFPTKFTGYDFFRSINFWRVIYGVTMISSPNTMAYDVEPANVDSITASPDYTIVFDRALDPGYEFAIVKMSLPMLPTHTNPGSNLKVIAGATDAGTEFSYGDFYQQRFGILPQSGDYIFCAFTIQSQESGFMYPLIAQPIIIT